MFIEPTITWVPSGLSGYIWLDTKIVLKNIEKISSPGQITLFFGYLSQPDDFSTSASLK